MANTRISDLTASASNLASTDLAPVVQTVGVGPVKMTGLQLAGGLLGSTTFNGSTVTTSSPVLNLTQTWNDGAGGTVTFTGLKFNATDTASAAASLLLDIGTGGGSYTSAFNVTKTGGFTFNDTATTTGTTPWRFLAPNLTAPGGATIFVGKDTNTGARLTYDALLSSAVVGVNISGTTAHVTLLAGGTGGFLYLRPGSSGATQLGAADAAAPVAQTFKVQGVVAGTSNTAGANFTIQGSQGTGTGAGGSIIFQVAPAGGSGTAQNAYSTALTIDSTRTATFAAGATFAAAVQGATNIGATNNLFAGAAFNNAAVLIGSSYGGIASVSTGLVSWTSSTTDPSGTRDLILARDAANTLALRNGGTSGTPVPQTFNIYNYWASASDYERGALKWTSNELTISTEKAGTGSSRSITLSSASNIFVDITANLNIRLLGSGTTTAWRVEGTSGNLVCPNDNTYDIGTSATSSRPRNIYVGTSLTLGDAANIVAQTTTGSKIGTATSQKIGFWNATPIVQPTTGVAAATVAATGVGDVVAASTTFDGYTIPQIVKAMRNAGLLA